MSLTAVKTTVILQDYRLIHNQHYMAQWVTLAFLFVPHKREVLPRLLVLFYFAAGLLKLNMAWLSGAALYGRRPFGLPADLIPAACWYVVALELVIVFGLLSRSRALWWAAFAQLIGFHVSSFWVVGYFYPVLMFLLLATLPVTRWAGSNSSELARRLAARRSIVAVTLTFAALQLAPRAYSTEPSITGEGRFLALHMFDAPTDCLAMRTYRAAGGREWSDAVHPRFVYPRIACDPLVHYELAASYCKQYPLEDGHPDFRMTLSTRRYGESEFRTIISLSDFCARRPPYSAWGHNPWITTR